MNNKLMIIIVIFIIVLTIITMRYNDGILNGAFNTDAGFIVVLDPGHGGIDGGAESAEGIAEKDINLCIALELKSLLEEEGVKVIMTRDEDVGLYNDEGNAAIRTLKTQDMHKRKEIIDSADADLAVSIHLNSFSQDANVRGAQVFYPGQGDAVLISKSKIAAELMQEDFNSTLNNEKKRVALQKDDVFILHNVTCPLVIAECGFLSNRDEAAMLSNHAYQGNIAKTLKISICRYLENNCG